MNKKQILFVDDEENIRAGIQRMLRRQSGEWDMYFVDGGKAALEVLARQNIDLLVTDMIMPGMTGLELLEEVVRQHPSVARMVLSGHVDDRSATKAVAVAHQFLSKPCDAETLKAAILQTLRISDLIENPRIRKALGDVGKIPALPRVYHELTAAMRSEQTDAKTISAIFARDMALSAKLLQLVNSSFFGLGRRVSGIAEAVMLLGVKQLQALVLSSHVFDSFSSRCPQCPIAIETLWRDAMATAQLARAVTLGEGLTGDRPDQAYMGGLLHNLGILLFASRMPEKFSQVLADLAADPTSSSLELERQHLGTTHAEAGAYILGLWNLPPRIVEAVALQHAPNVITYDGFCGVSAVHVAAAVLGETAEPPSRHFAPALDLDYLGRLGVSAKIEPWRQLARDIRTQAAAA